jgi:ABC-type transport system involved in cytochrome bd biosynthesis fused ATPase/permease subunit
MSNKFKEKPAEQQEKPKPAAPPRKQGKIARYIASVISGSFLSSQQMIRLLPFIFFLCFLAICYIANGYYAERKVKQLSQIANQLKELKSEYVVTKSDLMFISKQSEVAKAAAGIGIVEAKDDPPKKIIIKKTLAQQQDKN